jgi:transcriptional regulator with XRE-family HTH domain
MQRGESQPNIEDKRGDLRVQAGAWLRESREKAGFSQRDLAGRVGALYYTFISQIESGKGKIPPERYEAWAGALGVDSRDFAIRMLSFYEPTTYHLIFDAA